MIYCELFVEYANRGDVAMPAPVLVLHSTDKGLMTLDRSRLVPGGFFADKRRPEGFSDTVQILASGATPGLLQPGESARVPVYWAGQQEENDAYEPNPIDFTLFASTQDQTDPVDWNALRDSLRPAHVSAEAWASIYANFTSQVGGTWGSYIAMLNDNAAYLGRLGHRVTSAGEFVEIQRGSTRDLTPSAGRVVDVAELFAFELMQATGLHPVSTLASSVDAAVEAPGLELSFGRYAINSILGRYDTGSFGRGWHTPWDERLVLPGDSIYDKSVYITGPAGSRRLFRAMSNGFTNPVFSEPGDRGQMTRNADGSYDLREAGGLLRRFNTDGRLGYLEDLNGNRITAQYTGERLTRLSHSSGQFLAFTYNPGGRITSIADSEGETTSYTYDAASDHLASVKFEDDRTVGYTYSSGAARARARINQNHRTGRRHANLSV